MKLPAKIFNRYTQGQMQYAFSIENSTLGIQFFVMVGLVYVAHIPTQLLGLSLLNFTSTEIICSRTPKPGNGTKSSNSVAVDSLVVVTCSSGYVLTGNSHLQCLTSGQWNGTLGTCSGTDQFVVITAKVLGCEHPTPISQTKVFVRFLLTVLPPCLNSCR